MCRFQKEINSKIQEKKALETLADSTSTAPCSTEATEGLGASSGLPRDKASGVIRKVEEAPDGNTHNLEDGSSDAELHHCCGDSVGAARLHDLCCGVQHGMCHCMC